MFVPPMLAVPFVGLTPTIEIVPPGVRTTSLGSGLSVFVDIFAGREAVGIRHRRTFVTAIVISECLSRRCRP